MKTLGYLFFFLINLFAVFDSNAQKFEWVKSFGYKNSDFHSINFITKNEMSYLCYRYKDSTIIENNFHTTRVQNSIGFIVSKYNYNGNVIWTWKPDSVFNLTNISKIIVNENNNNLYVLGGLNGSIYINNVKYESNQGQQKLFLINLDTNGNFKRIFLLGDSNNIDSRSFELVDNMISLSIDYTKKSQTNNSIIPNINKEIKENCHFILQLDSNLVPKKISTIIKQKKKYFDFIYKL